MISRENTRQAVTALMISIGLANYHEIPMEEHADKLGVTKASVSKEVTIMRDVFMRSMNDQAAFGALKSRAVRDISREAQIKHYDRLREEIRGESMPKGKLVLTSVKNGNPPGNARDGGKYRRAAAALLTQKETNGNSKG